MSILIIYIICIPDLWIKQILIMETEIISLFFMYMYDHVR